MKVAFVSECYLPTRNGVVSSIESFRNHLEALSHAVHVFAPAHPACREELPYVHRFPSFSINSHLDYPIAIPWASSILSTFDKFSPDIVHTHSVFWLTRLGAYWAHKNQVPLVLTFHTLVTEYLHYIPLPRPLAHWLVVKLVAQYGNWCDFIITPTAVIVEMLRGFGITVPIEPLPTGVEVDELSGGDRQKVREKFSLPPNAEVLLYVGRIALEKNIDFLLDAACMVLLKRPQAYLLLVGSGPYEEKAKAHAKSLPVNSRIIFAGSHPKEEMKHFYAAADLFAFASCTETQGLALVEAMAASLPCVAVGQKGVRYVLKDGEGGFVVREDKKEFAECVLRLLEDTELRQRQGQKAKRRAEQNFSARVMAKRLVSLYEMVLENRRRGILPPRKPRLPFIL